MCDVHFLKCVPMNEGGAAAAAVCYVGRFSGLWVSISKGCYNNNSRGYAFEAKSGRQPFFSMEKMKRAFLRNGISLIQKACNTIQGERKGSFQA